MTRSARVVGVLSALSVGLVLTGCLSSEPLGKLAESNDKPFLLNVPQAEVPKTTARFQQADLPAQTPPVQIAQLTQAGGILPAPPQTPGLPANSASGIQQTSVNVPASALPTVGAPPTVRVCALVNERVIFQDEVWNLMGGPQQIQSMQPAQQQAAFKRALDDVIDSELLLQNAMEFMEKMSPEAAKKIKASAFREFQKNIKEMMRKQSIADMDQFNTILMKTQGTTVESYRRYMERNFIGDGFLHSKLESKLKVGNQEILDYYHTHINEFMKVDSVKWQDIFVAVGPKHPSMDDAMQFANQLGQRWATGTDIAKLLEFDDGQAAANKGAGIGENKGDIRPRELEPYLFAMKDGEFGPLVQLSTGVHVFRLLKRQYAGPMPFDEKTQTNIGKMLQNEIFRQERQRAVNKLRERASIQIISDQ
jgi:peptidyl-prolyl cis-trans isomerase SurA